MQNEPRHIKHVFELLQQVAAALNKHHDRKLWHLEVRLYDGEGRLVLTTDVPTVLDYFAADLYWNETSDWSNAVRAEVVTI